MRRISLGIFTFSLVIGQTVSAQPASRSAGVSPAAGSAVHSAMQGGASSRAAATSFGHVASSLGGAGGVYGASLSVGRNVTPQSATAHVFGQVGNQKCYHCGGTGNIGAYEGLNNSDPSSGNNNIGFFNGNGNTGLDSGNGNVGVGNGNFNSGNSSGNGNVGYFNGNYNTGDHSGNYNVGLANGIGNGGAFNGNGNEGVGNGNYNGVGYSAGSGNGQYNGNRNVGYFNGNNNGDAE